MLESLWAEVLELLSAPFSRFSAMSARSKCTGLAYEQQTDVSTRSLPGTVARSNAGDAHQPFHLRSHT